MRVVFWGTPAFATPSLRALIGEGHDVVGVVTQPDRAVGRHRSTTVPSPVKQVAQTEGIRVLQPESARDDGFFREFAELAPEISVVVAFGQILPRAVIDLPAQGTVNIHASLLPRYRGASPIQAAIRDGLDNTGVTVMRMVPKLDAGPILLQNATPIAPDETFGELELRLSELGALSLIEALILLSLGKVEAVEQVDSEATYAPRISRENGRIDWSADSASVGRLIRSFDPRPGAFTTRAGLDVAVFGARPGDAESGTAGEVIEITDNGMLVRCGQGAVRIGYVHPSGRKRMSPSEWAGGRGVRIGDVFGTTGSQHP